MNIITTIRTEIKKLEEKLKLIQDECNHPLSARITENHGATGNYDDPKGTYWTNHLCSLCEKNWSTDQDWKTTGDRKGLPVKK